MFDEAIKAFDKAIKINPQNARAWHNKANILYSMGKYEESIKIYNKARGLDPLLYANAQK